MPPEERLHGLGATYVMASFTHLNPKGSRFSNGSYGVYYAGDRFEVALAETVHHFEAFARDSGDGIRHEDMRVLVGSVDAEFHDVASLPAAEQDAVLDPNAYGASRAWAHACAWPEATVSSILASGTLAVCLGLPPKTVRPPIQTRHIKYHYDGHRVDAWFDYGMDRWHQL